MKRRPFSDASTSAGQCLCGTVRFEIDFPAFWAWHDHSRASRIAHGAGYATYVGTWRKRFRITAGESDITRYEDKPTGDVRGFCRRCGTPLALRARTFTSHDQHTARAVCEPHRPPAALSHRHRRAAGVDLHGRAARSAQGISGRGVGAIEKEEAIRQNGAALVLELTEQVGAAAPSSAAGASPGYGSRCFRRSPRSARPRPWRRASRTGHGRASTRPGRSA